MPKNPIPKSLPDDMAAAEPQTTPAGQGPNAPVRQSSEQSIDALNKLRGSVLHYEDPTEPVWED